MLIDDVGGCHGIAHGIRRVSVARGCLVNALGNEGFGERVLLREIAPVEKSERLTRMLWCNRKII